MAHPAYVEFHFFAFSFLQQLRLYIFNFLFALILPFPVVLFLVFRSASFFREYPFPKFPKHFVIVFPNSYILL